APQLVEAYRAALPIRTVLIWARRSEQSKALAASLEAVAVDDLDAALARADIVSSATLSRSPLIHGASLRAGMHIDLVGAFSPKMREVDAAAVARSTVFVDTLGGAKAEAGDLIQAIAEDQFSWGMIAADLAALVTGAHPGRANPEEITLFKSVGAAIEDLAIARLVLKAAGS
ncbi:MAG: ornithine cyclodeaminase family protein, partial [Devosia sp.]